MSASHTSPTFCAVEASEVSSLRVLGANMHAEWGDFFKVMCHNHFFLSYKIVNEIPLVLLECATFIHYICIHTLWWSSWKYKCLGD